MCFINKYDELQLKNVLLEYGELRSAAGIARLIVEARGDKPIKSSDQLKKVIRRFLPQHRENKILAQIYQAIRIEVNEELDALKEFLIQSLVFLL